MRRLVYAPRAYAYVATEHHGVFNLSPYITRGSVNRVVNAPSSAEIEFRNPNMMFTRESRTKKGPYFRPMDRITIWLERIRGFPVQVFTGYIDTAPYLQLYPGPCTITASCTLKRLHNIYWDMGLSYTANWLRKYGWETSRSSGTILGSNAERRDLDPGDPQLTDGSIGDLLYGTLLDVADWPKDSIHIETLPEKVIEKVTNIWLTYMEDSKLVAEGIEDMISKYIGSGQADASSKAKDRSVGKAIEKTLDPDAFKSGGKLRTGSDSAVASSSGGTKGTRYQAIVARANKMHQLAMAGLPYSNARVESQIWDAMDNQGYDCSSSCASLMKAAGYDVPWFSTADAPNYMEPGAGERLTFWNNDISRSAGNSVHMFAEIEGRMWGTGNGLSGHWFPHTTEGFRPFHLKGLDEDATIPRGANTSPGGIDQGDEGANWEDVMATSKATAFVHSLQFAGLEEAMESSMLTGGRSLMNDKPLFPFIEQLSQAAMRSFQSLPNGDFYAFYPDYFGNIGNRRPYWEIDDVEILDGEISLSDENLYTHVFAVGDTTPLTPGIDFLERLTTTGVVNIYNKAQSGFTGAANTPETREREQVIREAQREAVVSDPGEVYRFLAKYGARPWVEEAPFIRNRFFEAFLAWTQFDLLWSRQFLTDFTFTFMPEIFPGGLIAFPQHTVQCYVDQVTHTFDYEAGFTTTASLSAPATLSSEELKSDPLTFGLVRAGAES